MCERGTRYQHYPTPIRIDRETGEMELEVCEGPQVKKATPPPPTRMDIDSGAAVSGIRGALGVRNQTVSVTRQ